MSDNTKLPRQTGSEKVDAECATCGKELPAVTTEYGSVVRGVCPKCEALTEDGQLKAQKAAAARAAKKAEKDSDG